MTHQKLILEPGEECQQGITWQVETSPEERFLSRLSYTKNRLDILNQ
jgi:hypothetical protein